VADPLLLDHYRKLPQPGSHPNDGQWTAGLQQALRDFRAAVVEHYSEGTLCRLLNHTTTEVRQAATLGLGLIGTFASNSAVAEALKDDDDLVRRFAHDTLWEIWFRGGDTEHCWSLRQAMQLPDGPDRIAALDDLIAEAPEFAEARHQRGMQRFRLGEIRKCAADCKSTLQLNPVHFAAAAALGQCYLRLKRPRAALKAFERALKIHPNLLDLHDAVKTLQDVLGER
jgi:tetratricopeptide (TPR) repeat protein